MKNLLTTAACRGFLVAGLALLGLAGCDDGDTGLVVAGEFPVAWVERALPREMDGTIVPDNLRDPGEFRPGARLMLKRRAAPAALAIDITSGLFAPGETYDVRDVSASWDGTRLLFALRGPFIEDAQDEDQPTWNVWEYDIATETAHRVIASTLIAEEGHDIMPAYLPDNRIVFASTRQRASRAVLVDEGKPQFAMLDDTRRNEVFLLHVMNADGTGIHQITFNGAHDLSPTVLQNGRVLFARQVQNRGRVAMHLYSVLPDGRDVAPAFGGASHDTVGTERVEFTQPQVLEDGRVLVIERPYVTDFFGGALSIIDVENFSDENQRVDAVVGSGGIAAIDMPAYPGETLASRAGRYTDAVPLGDNTGRLLVSWSSCRLEVIGSTPLRILPCAGNDVADPLLREAAPIYGVFVFDPATGARLPVVVPAEGVLYEHVAVAAPRRLPTFLPDATAGAGLDAALLEEGVGVLDIRSVYDLDGAFSPLGSLYTSIAAVANPLSASAGQRPARWLRLEKIVAIPDRMVRDFRNTAFGVNAGNGMREILGYAPVEPDGSVRVKLPANVPFTFSVVDARGMRIGNRHTAWLQLVPGEQRMCSGCHANTSTLPHGRADSGVLPLHAGAAGGAPYPNTRAELIAEPGETMAQLRTRLDPALLSPTMDVRYADVWTDPAVRAPDAVVDYLYADLLSPMPATDACQTAWMPMCRSVIHYETHIHPLWAIDRRVLDADGVTVLADHTCISCHNGSADPADVVEPLELLSQLDLRDGFSGEVATRMAAYQELLAADSQQVLDSGSLVDRLVQARDAGNNLVFEVGVDGVPIRDSNGDLVPVMVTVNVPASMSAGNARGSTGFFNLFRAGGTHDGWLTPAELRLLGEWVDIGAQYYNDPFAAPLN